MGVTGGVQERGDRHVTMEPTERVTQRIVVVLEGKSKTGSANLVTHSCTHIQGSPDRKVPQRTATTGPQFLSSGVG